jgi:hypothetical protein
MISGRVPWCVDVSETATGEMPGQPPATAGRIVTS